MIFYSAKALLNSEEPIEIVNCSWCGEEPHVRHAAIFCGCGNRIESCEFSEAVAAWNRANSTLEVIIKSAEATV